MVALMSYEGHRFSWSSVSSSSTVFWCIGFATSNRGHTICILSLNFGKFRRSRDNGVLTIFLRWIFLQLLAIADLDLTAGLDGCWLFCLCKRHQISGLQSSMSIAHNLTKTIAASHHRSSGDNNLPSFIISLKQKIVGHRFGDFLRCDK